MYPWRAKSAQRFFLSLTTGILPSMSFFRKVSESESESDSDEERMSDYEEDAEKKETTAAPPKKSAFTKGGASGSSDEDESDDDDDDDDDEGDSDEESGEEKQGGPKKASRFLRGAIDDSDSEDDVKKVIKSAKDKRVDEMDAIVRTIENAQRIDDWVAISKGEQLSNRRE